MHGAPPRVPLGHRPVDHRAEVAPHLGPLAGDVVGQQGELVGVAQQHGGVPQRARSAAWPNHCPPSSPTIGIGPAARGLAGSVMRRAAVAQARANAATGAGSPPGWTCR